MFEHGGISSDRIANFNYLNYTPSMSIFQVLFIKKIYIVKKFSHNCIYILPK